MLRLLLLLLLISGVTLVGANYESHPLPLDARADRVLIEKSARRLTLIRGGTPLKSYAVALGRCPRGPKQQEGDHRTPEGTYTIDAHKHDSAFHRALHVSYPSPKDTVSAAQRRAAPGGNIMIHGIRNGLGWLGAFHRAVDWTTGCIAVTNKQIEEISRAVPDGTPIEIRP